MYVYVYVYKYLCICACAFSLSLSLSLSLQMVVRATEKIEAGKRNRSTQGWAGVILNQVVRLTVTFEQSPER